jgi:hypothetical protein
MLHDLLLRVQYLQVSRNSFDTVRFVNLAIDELQMLKQVVFRKVALHRIGFGLFLAVILLPVEKCTSIRATLYRSLRDDLGRYRLQQAFHCTDLLNGLHLVAFRDATTGLPGQESRISSSFALFLKPGNKVIKYLKYVLCSQLASTTDRMHPTYLTALFDVDDFRMASSLQFRLENSDKLATDVSSSLFVAVDDDMSCRKRHDQGIE